VKFPTMWCALNPKGQLLPGTLSFKKGEVVFHLFGMMSERFQKDYWKQLEATRKELRRRGYRTVKVKIVPLDSGR
jgi:cell division protein YceG involved in septum cleavage